MIAHLDNDRIAISISAHAEGIIVFSDDSVEASLGIRVGTLCSGLASTQLIVLGADGPRFLARPFRGDTVPLGAILCL